MINIVSAFLLNCTSILLFSAFVVHESMQCTFLIRWFLVFVFVFVYFSFGCYSDAFTLRELIFVVVLDQVFFQQSDFFILNAE